MMDSGKLSNACHVHQSIKRSSFTLNEMIVDNYTIINLGGGLPGRGQLKREGKEVISTSKCIDLPSASLVLHNLGHTS